jgi:hypothetical protein
MNFKKLSLILIVGLIMVGCASKSFIKPNQVQIDTYIQAHPDLPELDKSCIYDGRFEIGIMQETLKFLLGEPATFETVKQPWAVQEKLMYKKGNQKVFIIEDKHVVGILEQDK